MITERLVLLILVIQLEKIFQTDGLNVNLVSFLRIFYTDFESGENLVNMHFHQPNLSKNLTSPICSIIDIQTKKYIITT